MKHFLHCFGLTLIILSGLPARGQYIVTDLNSSTFTPTTGQGVSGAFQVGVGTLNGQPQALYWNNSSTAVTNLTPIGYTQAYALGVSGNLETGFGVTTTGKTMALLWSLNESFATNLNPTIGGTALALSVANGISGTQEVGYGQFATGGTFALVWNSTASSAVNLNPTGYSSSQAYGTSGTRQVGYADIPAGYSHAVMWSSTAASAVDLNPSGYQQSFAQAISGLAAVGFAQVSDGNYQAFLWTGTAASATNLNPTGFTTSFALGVSSTTVVGYGVTTTGQQEALLWNGTASSFVNLSAFLPSGATNAEARGIDSSGNIVGYATVNSQTHAFLWQPTVPPSFTSVAQSATTVVGLNYKFTFTASGFPVVTSYSLISGNLPTGLVLSSTGVLSGVPTQVGTYTGTVKASNGVSPDATQNFSINVMTAPFNQLSTVCNCISADGYSVFGPLIQGSDGNFYNTATNGGTGNDGTLLEITSGGKETLLHSFGDGSVTNDGTFPIGVMQGPDTAFYGATILGGSSNNGAIFKNTGGVTTILHSFKDGSVTLDGANPIAPFQVKDGNFYGVTSGGGSTTSNGGTIFEITPQGAVTILYRFKTGSVTNDGFSPGGPLLLASDGNFYGTTYYGGSALNSGVGYGTAFRMTPDGTVTILHAFGDGSLLNDGQNPVSALVQGSDGNIYGICSSGGAAGKGTIYRMTTSGSITILRSFGDGKVGNDGAFSQGTTNSQCLIQGADGNFYGETPLGGYANEGTLFQMTPQGSMLVLHSFGDGSIANDGLYPNPLTLGSDGNFYGMTENGGSAGYGILFKFSLQSAPTIPINASPPVAGTTGVTYSFTFVAAGYPPPTFTLTSGSLPPGLTLSSAGVLSGTPTQSGTFSGTVTASNGIGTAATQSFTISITAPVPDTDTPTMPPWALLILAMLFMITATKSLPRFSPVPPKPR